MSRLMTAVLIAASSAGWAAEPLSLQALLQQARQNNPDINQARHGWKVKLDEVSPTRAWPDPTFTFVDEEFPSGVAGVGPMPMRHYRIEQTIPFPGKLSNDARMKYHEALIADATYRATVLEVFRDVQSRYYQLYLTDQLIGLAQDSIGVLRQLLASAQARLASAQTSATDVFMAQTELRRMENTLLEQKQQRALIQAEINTLVDQPVDRELGAARPPALREAPASLDEAQKLAASNNPLYLSAMHEVHHSRAMMAHHTLQFLPDFGFMYERETANAGPDGRQIGVSMTFPLWFQRPWGLRRSAEEHLAEAEAASQAMRNEVQKNVFSEYTQTKTLAQEAENFESGILPAAQSAMSLTRQQYASGHTDFLKFLEAFRAWIQTNTEYQMKLYEYGDHWSQLERWVGMPLDEASQAPAQPQPKEMKHDH